MKKDTTALIERLRKTRSINDVVGVVRQIAQEVRAGSRLLSTSATRKPVDSGEIEIDHTTRTSVKPPVRVPVRSPAATDASLGVKLTKFVAPDPAAVKKHSDIIERLHENAQELESAEALVRQAFAKAKNQKQVLSAIHALQEEVNASLAKAFTALDAIANKHLPEEMETLGDSLVAYIIDHINPKYYSNIHKEVYATFDGPTTVFSMYVVINELQASTGFVYDEFYVILTGTVTQGGVINYYLNTMPDFKIPGHFPIGKEVKNTTELTLRVSTLIAHNDIASDLERKPMPLDTKRAKSGGMAGIRYVEDVYVLDDSLFIVVEKGRETRKNLVDIQSQVVPLLNQLTKNSRGTKGSVQMKTQVREGKTVMQYIFTPSGDHKTHTLNLDRLNDVQDMLDLSPAEVHALKEILKHK